MGCGLQQCSARYDLTTIDQCAERCAGFANCRSFTWAEKDQDSNHMDNIVCTMYDTDEPTHEWGDGQIFCKRTPGKK